VLFKLLFFAKEYPTNKALNTGNKILIKNDKSYFLEKKFMFMSRIVKLNILTRKTTDKTQHGSSANF
jgi:hypothetical protein